MVANGTTPFKNIGFLQFVPKNHNMRNAGIKKVIIKIFTADRNSAVLLQDTRLNELHAHFLFFNFGSNQTGNGFKFHFGRKLEDVMGKSSDTTKTVSAGFRFTSVGIKNASLEVSRG